MAFKRQNPFDFPSTVSSSEEEDEVVSSEEETEVVASDISSLPSIRKKQKQRNSLDATAASAAVAVAAAQQTASSDSESEPSTEYEVDDSEEGSESECQSILETLTEGVSPKKADIFDEKILVGAMKGKMENTEQFLLNEGMKMLKGETKIAMEAKWKEYNLAQMKLFLQKIALMRELGGIVLQSYKNGDI